MSETHRIPPYEKLFQNNREWAASKLEKDPDYFKNLSRGQHPMYLWIGCSDSRVPANEITKTEPGEIFIHRNVANLVVHTDLNFMSVLQYAVEILKVEHIIVCGHYGCGGVLASATNASHGLIDKWLRTIKDVYRLHHQELNAITDEVARGKRLVELNVKEQVLNLYKTSIVQRAWARKQPLEVHGWIYDIETGLVHELEMDLVREWSELDDIYHLNFDDVPAPAPATTNNQGR